MQVLLLVSRDSLFSPTTRGSGQQEKTFNEIMKMAQELKLKKKLSKVSSLNQLHINTHGDIHDIFCRFYGSQPLKQ